MIDTQYVEARSLCRVRKYAEYSAENHLDSYGGHSARLESQKCCVPHGRIGVQCNEATPLTPDE